MRFFQALEFFLSVLIAIVLTTQVVIPLWRGRPLFPLARRRARLESELREIADEVETARLERKLENVREELDEPRSNDWRPK